MKACSIENVKGLAVQASRKWQCNHVVINTVNDCYDFMLEGKVSNYVYKIIYEKGDIIIQDSEGKIIDNVSSTSILVKEKQKPSEKQNNKKSGKDTGDKILQGVGDWQSEMDSKE